MLEAVLARLPRRPTVRLASDRLVLGGPFDRTLRLDAAYVRLRPGARGRHLQASPGCCHERGVSPNAEGHPREWPEILGASASRSQPAHHLHRLVIGKLNVRIPAHGHRTVKVTLNRAGRRLLAKQGKLEAEFIVTVGGRTVESVPVTFTAKAPKRHKRG